MKLSRIAAAVTTAALAPAVLIASPAFATTNAPGVPADTTAPTAQDQAPDPSAGQTGGQTGSQGSGQSGSQTGDESQAEKDRKAILVIIAHPRASAYMKEAGHKAIADGPAAMRKFIETDQFTIRRDDYRILILRLDAEAGPGLHEGIQKIMDSDTTLDQLIHFYDVTQHELRDQDNRVKIAQIIDKAGPALREAGKKALNGTPAERAEFLKTGQYLAQATDDRAELARIDAAWDGPILSGAISKLLNGSPTPAELRHFLEVTQYELRDQDNRAAIEQLIKGGGPELVKAARAALAGTPQDRTDFLKTGQYEAREKDRKAKEKQDKEKEKEQSGNDGQSGTGSGTGTGNGAVTPQGGSGSLATTGSDGSVLIAGGAGTALLAGAGLLLAARMRRAGSGS